MNLHATFRERPPNWLPVPGAHAVRERREARVNESDFFTKGEVLTFLPKQGRGVLKNAQGDLIAFDLKTVSLIGEAGDIQSGMRVGYDVARTSHGNRVTTLKIY